MNQNAEFFLEKTLSEKNGPGYRLSLRDSSGACCGENRPDWYTISKWLNEETAKVLVSLNVASYKSKEDEPNQKICRCK